MQAISARELLAAWERAHACPASERPLWLLELALPHAREELTRLPIGERDALLLALREAAFGPRLESVARCPACGELLEFSLNIAELRVRRDQATAEPLTLGSGVYELRFRLPNTSDLTAIECCRDADSSRRLLIERCLLEARCDGHGMPPEAVPEALVAEMIERMAEADPQGQVDLNLSCPQCGAEWAALFDIGSYLWIETEEWAQRTLREVAALAAALGWGETDILGMSARRRRFYLGLIA